MQRQDQRHVFGARRFRADGGRPDLANFALSSRNDCGSTTKPLPRTASFEGRRRRTATGARWRFRPLITKVWPAVWPPWKRQRRVGPAPTKPVDGSCPFLRRPHWRRRRRHWPFRRFSFATISKPSQKTAGAARMRGIPTDKDEGYRRQARRGRGTRLTGLKPMNPLKNHPLRRRHGRRLPGGNKPPGREPHLRQKINPRASRGHARRSRSSPRPLGASGQRRHTVEAGTRIKRDFRLGRAGRYVTEKQPLAGFSATSDRASADQGHRASPISQCPVRPSRNDQPRCSFRGMSLFLT